jgi:hypothetical protein
VFLEPALGFSVVAYQEQGLPIRVWFTAEAAPPWPPDGPGIAGSAWRAAAGVSGWTLI